MFNTGLFLLLFALGIVGLIAGLPYILAALPFQSRPDGKPLPEGPALIGLISIQPAMIALITSALGTFFAPRAGFGAPLFTTFLEEGHAPPGYGSIALLAVLAGLLSYLAVAILEFGFFHRRLPPELADSEINVALWKRLLVTLYGGIDEELMLRWGLLPLIAWLIGLVWRTSAGLPTTGAFWVANILVAVLFGLGHLPATAQITPLTPLIVVRAILLNGLFGVVSGYLFWLYGLAAAMIAHATADVFIHTITVEVMKGRRATKTVA